MSISGPAHTTLTREFANTAERLRESTVHVRSGRMGGGSGVIWRADGLVVTNAHVARTPRVQIELADGREFDGEVIAIDPRRDLAAVKLQASALPVAPVGDSNGLRVGQLVVAVGNPLGLSGALTIGIIHAIAPSESRQGTWVQADVRLDPGNSGGPLADVFGQVVGINSMVAGELGLAVPSNDVTAFLQRGSQRAFLGVTTQPVAIDQNGVRAHGLLVLTTESGSPAELAGLWMGDVLVGVSDQPLRGPRDLAAAIHGAGPGGVLRLRVVRAGIQRAVDVALAAPITSGAEEQEAA